MPSEQCIACGYPLDECAYCADSNGNSTISLTNTRTKDSLRLMVCPKCGLLQARLLCQEEESKCQD